MPAGFPFIGAGQLPQHPADARPRGLDLLRPIAVPAGPSPFLGRRPRTDHGRLPPCCSSGRPKRPSPPLRSQALPVDPSPARPAISHLFPMGCRTGGGGGGGPEVGDRVQRFSRSCRGRAGRGWVGLDQGKEQSRSRPDYRLNAGMGFNQSSQEGFRAFRGAGAFSVRRPGVGGCTNRGIPSSVPSAAAAPLRLCSSGRPSNSCLRRDTFRLLDCERARPKRGSWAAVTAVGLERAAAKHFTPASRARGARGWQWSVTSTV